MDSRRPALAVLAAVTAVVVAGCGSGRNIQAYLPEAAPPTVGEPRASVPPPVVVVGPDSAASRRDGSERSARRSQREASAKPRPARERPAARPPAADAADAPPPPPAPTRPPARRKRPAAPEPARRPAAEGQVGGSGVSGRDLIAERNRRSDAEARAAVVRFHELLDRRDARACLLLTPKLLEAVHGSDRPLERCQEAVAAITAEVSVQIAESRAHGARASVAVISRWGEEQVAQTLRLVLDDGTWLIDEIQRNGTS